MESKPTVATPSLAYESMRDYWFKIGTVLAGTQAMRDAGQKMAPRHERESVANYRSRLQGNVLFNVTDLTLRTWVGKPFSADIQYDKDFPEFIKPWLEDINLEGDNLSVFARQWFSTGVAKAFCHVLVDFPRIEKEGRTARDDMEENIRPYCVMVDPERLFFATHMRIGSEEVLTHARIMEEVVTVEGWAEVVTEQIRVYTLEFINNGTLESPKWDRVVRVELYQRAKDAKSGDEWFVVDSWFMDIPFIPIVTFYANREGFMVGKSPLADLVDLNIRHWQSMSDQINILTVTRFPILALSGGSADEEGAFVVGPREWLFTDDPAAKFYYVEHHGAAISAGETDLKNLEERMKSYGAEFMKDRPDRETASSRNLDTAEATSPLQDVVYRFNDALNYMFYMMAAWVDKEYNSHAKVPTDFTSPEQVELKIMFDTWVKGGITDEEYLQELHRRGCLSDSFKLTNRSQRKEQANVELRQES